MISKQKSSIKIEDKNPVQNILIDTHSSKKEQPSKIINDKVGKNAEKKVQNNIEDTIDVNVDEKIASLTGKGQVNVNKVFISDFNAAPGLAYVDLKISSIKNETPESKIDIRALHDSGCAKSIIKTSVFNDLLKKGVIEIKNPPQ